MDAVESLMYKIDELEAKIKSLKSCIKARDEVLRECLQWDYVHMYQERLVTKIEQALALTPATVGEKTEEDQ